MFAKKKTTKAIGMQVPGPLSKTRFGLDLHMSGMALRIERRVVNIEVK
jgi:hypothetical protein